MAGMYLEEFCVPVKRNQHLSVNDQDCWIILMKDF